MGDPIPFRQRNTRASTKYVQLRFDKSSVTISLPSLMAISRAAFCCSGIGSVQAINSRIFTKDGRVSTRTF